MYVIYYWWTDSIHEKLDIFIIVKNVYTLYMIKSINKRSERHITCIEVL